MELAHKSMHTIYLKIVTKNSKHTFGLPQFNIFGLFKTKYSCS